MRESDYVIRWGGDEFLLLLSCSEAEAAAKARQLRTAFDRERASSRLPDYVGVSIGVAGVSKGADSLRLAVSEADSKMYGDKHSERPVRITRPGRPPERETRPSA